MSIGPPGQTVPSGQTAAPGGTTAPDETAPTPALTGSITDSPVVRLAGPRAAQPYDAFLARVVTDLEAFWDATYPTIADGEPYLPLEGGVWPVWPTAENVPGCGSGRTSYREVQDNAFYCPDDDFIAFDDIGLFPDLDTRFGRYTVATVLAHEWGHAIQSRRGYSLPGVIAELQADCFSGAWMGHIRAGDTPDLRLDDPDLRRAVTGILEFRDAPGTSAGDEGAHGSAFDRLGSYQDGLEKGARSCDAYAVTPPVVIELPFNDAADVSTKGNLPLPKLVGLVPQDLDRFWVSTFEASGSSFSPLTPVPADVSPRWPLPSLHRADHGGLRAGRGLLPQSRVRRLRGRRHQRPAAGHHRGLLRRRAVRGPVGAGGPAPVGDEDGRDGGRPPAGLPDRGLG